MYPRLYGSIRGLVILLWKINFLDYMLYRCRGIWRLKTVACGMDYHGAGIYYGEGSFFSGKTIW